MQILALPLKQLSIQLQANNLQLNGDLKSNGHRYLISSQVDGLKPFQLLIPSRFKLKVVALLMFGFFFQMCVCSCVCVWGGGLYDQTDITEIRLCEMIHIYIPV